jgi:hypothetical protein
VDVYILLPIIQCQSPKVLFFSFLFILGEEAEESEEEDDEGKANSF